MTHKDFIKYFKGLSRKEQIRHIILFQDIADAGLMIDNNDILYQENKNLKEKIKSLEELKLIYYYNQILSDYNKILLSVGQSSYDKLNKDERAFIKKDISKWTLKSKILLELCKRICTLSDTVDFYRNYCKQQSCFNNE